MYRQVLVCILVAWMGLGACSRVQYRFETEDQSNIVSRAESRTAGSFQVRASLPGPAEAENLFGIDVQKRRVQPVWLEVSNNGDRRGRIAISSIDSRYFPPAEVAYFFRKQFSREGWMALESRLIDISLPRFVAAGETVSGFVFTNYSPGTKAFNLDIFLPESPPTHEQFTFFLTEPGFEPDYAGIRFAELYDPEQTVQVDEEGLRALLKEFECCSTNRDGSQRGRPVNIFIVSDGRDLLRALLRAGWLETARATSDSDPAAAHHLFGRVADGVFRKPRDNETDRSELSLWKMPVLVGGKPVWAGQLRHSIGRRFALGERLFGVHLDPDTIDGRNYVLQSFWYAQSLRQWALSSSGIEVPESSPVLDFLGNPWFSTDNLRVVIWISPTPVSMTEARMLGWTADGDDGGAGEDGS